MQSQKAIRYILMVVMMILITVIGIMMPVFADEADLGNENSEPQMESAEPREPATATPDTPTPTDTLVPTNTPTYTPIPQSTFVAQTLTAIYDAELELTHAAQTQAAYTPTPTISLTPTVTNTEIPMGTVVAATLTAIKATGMVETEVAQTHAAETEIYAITQTAQTPTPTETATMTFTATPDINPELTTPTGLLLTQLSGTNSLRLRWNRVVTVDCYRVWIAKGSPNSELETQDVIGNIYFDYPVSNAAETIYFRVAALKDDKVSTPSAWVGGRINISAPKVGFPVLNGTSQVILSWQDVPGATKYEVSRSEEGLAHSESYFQTAGTETEMFVTLPNPTKKYFFKARAFVENIGGPWSEAVTYPFSSGQLAAPVLNPISITAAKHFHVSWPAYTGATGYEVYRSETSASSGFKRLIRLGNATSIVTSAPVKGKTYYYRIVALVGSVSSPPSNIVSGMIPTEELIKPVINPITQNSLTTLRVSWSAVPGATGYRVWRSETSENSGYGWTVTLGKDMTTIVTSVQPGKTYYYKVAALSGNTVGWVSDPASGHAVYLRKPVMNPVTQAGADSVRVSWSEILNATGYRVWRSEVSPDSGYGWAVSVGSGQTAILTRVEPGKTYYYKVAALSDSILGPTSEPVSGGAFSLTAPRVNPVTEAGANKLTLSWAPVPNATGYRVWRSETAPTSGYGWVKNVGNVTEYKMDAVYGKQYFYRVAAVSGSFIGPLSAPVPGKSTVLPTPTLKPITILSGLRIHVSWTQIPGVTGYRIWRSTTSANSGYYPVITLDETHSAIVSGVEAGKTYYYKIAALDGDKVSPVSAPTEIRIP